MTDPPAPATVTTPDECVRFVDAVGLCAWRPGTELRSLEDVTPWGERTMLGTWFWKDDLHLERRVCYGQLWNAGNPVFVSRALLPALIAAQGDIDPDDLYEQGRLSRVARELYRHIDRNGPTPKNRLPYPPRTSQTPPLVQLQQTFLLTKTGLTGRTRGTYGYVWGKADAFWPEAFAAAAALPVAQARQAVIAVLQRGNPTLSAARIARALRWPGDAS
jgi:hypothetical protein